MGISVLHCNPIERTWQLWNFVTVTLTLDLHKLHLKWLIFLTSVLDNEHRNDGQGHSFQAPLNGFLSPPPPLDQNKEHGLKQNNPLPRPRVGLHLQAPETPGCPHPLKNKDLRHREHSSPAPVVAKVVSSYLGLTCTLKSSPALTAQPSLIGSLLPRYSAHCRAGGP